MAISKAYASSGKIFEQVSVRNSPGLAEQLKAIEPGEIVVVQGTYDHVEKLLDTIHVPYALIEREEMKTHNGGRVMFVNCASYDNGTGVPKKSLEQFVQDGGRLVTTDWAVSVITHAFPGRLEKKGKTTDDVVEIQCPTDIARRLIGLNYAQCHPKWWLEGSSDVYDIKNGVVPIITSDEMKEKYGSPHIAVGFAEGKGEVVHFISHLELQRTHLRTKADKEGLDAFLEKMKTSKTADMEDASVAELEAAYSTLNTLAYLCARTPLLNTGGMKSMTTAKSVGSAKSMRLA
ncbi:hypothetical protein HY490_00050 [Candidatus Woesearchaeota archaeon]|nr:hypothetical protein [Candidatus Woesearchaeota archaeon]